MTKTSVLVSLLVAVVMVAGSFYVFTRSSNEPKNVEALLENSVEKRMGLTLSSSAFENDEAIPAKYSCDGKNIHPPFTVQGVPEGTGSLVLVMDDPDIPDEIKKSRGIEKFNHWVVYNIPADTTSIEEGATVGTAGLNSANTLGYRGPCPPPEYEPSEHRYVFRLFAIKGTLTFEKEPTLDEVETAARGNMLEGAALIGRYDRSR